MPLPYLHCAPPLPLMKKRKEKRDKRVFDHTLRSLSGKGKKKKKTILVSDYFQVTICSCWSCHQPELEERTCQWCILPEQRSADRCRWDTGAAPAPELGRTPAIACSSRISVLVRFQHAHPGVGPLPSSQSGCREDENCDRREPEGGLTSSPQRRRWSQNKVYQSENTQRSQDQRQEAIERAERTLSFNAAAFAGRRGNFSVTNLNFPFTFFLFFSLG